MRTHHRLTAFVVGAAFAIAATAHADDAPIPAETSHVAPSTTAQPAASVQPAPVQPATAAPVDAPVQPAAPAVVVASSDEQPRPKLGLCIGIGAGAIALFVVGGVLGGLALSKSHDQDGNVKMPTPYTPSLANGARSGEALADTAYAMLAVGGVLAVADIVLWAEKLRRHHAPTASASAAVVGDAARLVGSVPKTTVTPGPFSLRVTF